MRRGSDCFNTVWGPCELMKQSFYMFVCEMVDAGRNLKIVQAQVDKISSLKAHQNKSMPTFLFYLNGQLLQTIEGPQLPKIRATIQEHAFTDPNCIVKDKKGKKG